MADINLIELKTKIAELSQALVDRHPAIPTLLATIHRTVRQYPEQVTLLDEEEIQTCVRGLEVHQGIYLATSITKSAKSATASKKIKGMTLDDI